MTNEEIYARIEQLAEAKVVKYRKEADDLRQTVSVLREHLQSKQEAAVKNRGKFAVVCLRCGSSDCCANHLETCCYTCGATEEH